MPGRRRHDHATETEAVAFPRSNSDARLRDLEAAVARLSERVDALTEEVRHHDQQVVASDAPAAVPSQDLVAPGATRQAAPGWLGLTGRTCIVLGGAFLLRALTESGQLPAAGGVWLGLAYAAPWLTMAGRAVGPSSFFHGVAALIVALPLIIEAALKFHVLSAGASAAVLAAIAVASLSVASRRHQHTFAILATLGAIVTAFALAFGLGTLVPSVLALLVIGAATLWVAYSRGWNGLPWLAAAAANLGVLLLAILASAIPPRDDPLAAQAAHALLIVVYVGSFVIRVLRHERGVRPFEVVQTAAALALGLAGATAIAHAQHMGVGAIAVSSLIAGGLLYALTFARVAPRRGFGPEFYYLGMTALALSLVGISLLFPYPARPMAIGGGALLATLVAWRFGHPMLALQGAIVAIVASAQSGLITFTARVWMTHSQLWPAAALPIWIVLAAVSAALLIPRAVHEGESPVLVSVARVALSVALVAGAGSLIVIALGRMVPGAAANPGLMATMKTVLLSVAAAVLALTGRSRRFLEFGWLAYGVLAACAAKILFEDLSTSRPSTLFIALAFYGAALILVPRVSRHDRQIG